MSTHPLRFAALAVALLALGASLSAQDQGPGQDRGPMGRGHGPMGGGHEFRGLNLTEDQKTKLKAVHESHQATLKAKEEAAGAAHKALREAMDSDATDAKALRSLHDKASAAQFDLLLEHRALRQETLALLTPEQKAKLPKGPMGKGWEGHGMGPGFDGPRHGGPGPDGPGH